MPKRKTKNPKRKAYKAVKKIVKTKDLTARLGKALAKRTKSDLIEALLELAKSDSSTFRRLCTRFDLVFPPEELAYTTSLAISNATDFDECEINYSFNYDGEAYDEVKRNFSRLIKQKQLPLAMELSLELMKQGSYQVEMSDEGLMTDDIEECLQVVVKAAKKSSLPAAEIVAWCKNMTASDRVGFICDKKLRDLQNHFEKSIS